MLSPPLPSKPDPKPTDDASKNKTDSAPPAKTPDPNPDPKGSNNGTKPGPVSPPIDAGDRKKNQTQKKDPNPVPEQKPKDEDNPTPVPEQKPKENPNPVPGKTQSEKDQSGKHSDTEPGSASPPPPPPEGGKEKSPEIDKTKNKNDNGTNSPDVKKESCDGETKTCSNSDMVACIKSFNSGKSHYCWHILAGVHFLLRCCALK